MSDILIEAFRALLPDIRQIIAEELRNQKLEQLQERYLTGEKTRELCGGVSRQTLYNWDEKGFLNSHLIGGRRLWKYSEVVNAIEKIKNYASI
jgi:hypothetical protein